VRRGKTRGVEQFFVDCEAFHPANGEDEGLDPGGGRRGIAGIEQAVPGEGRDGGEMAAGEEAPIPGLGGLFAVFGVVAIELGKDVVGEHGLAGLPKLGEKESGAVVGGIEFVGVGKGEKGLGGAAFFAGRAGFFEITLRLRDAQFAPGRRPDGLAIGDPVAHRGEEREGEKRHREVGGEAAAGEQEKRPAPERADPGGVDGADPRAVGATLQQGADRAEASGGVKMGDGLATGFVGAAGIARDLARAAVAAAAQDVPGFAGVPRKRAPAEEEEVGYPADHFTNAAGKKAGGRAGRSVKPAGCGRESPKKRDLPVADRRNLFIGGADEPETAQKRKRLTSVMKILRLPSILRAGVAAAGLFAAAVLGAATVGEPAPAFTLTDLDGKTHNLADYKGKTVILEWVNAECPFVVKHYDKSGNLPATQKAAAAEGAVWLQINSAAPGKQGDFDAEKAKAWQAKHGVAGVPYFRDVDGTVGKAYGAKTTPHIFVINPEGVLVYNGAIDSIRSADPKDIEKAENYVKSALEALKAGKPIATPVTQPYGCSVKY